jgi:DNA mismatch repair ATPase MutL
MIQNSLSSAQVDEKCQVTSLQLRVLTNQRYRQHLMSWGFHYSLNKFSLLIFTVPVIEGESLTRLDLLEFVDYLSRNEDLPMRTLKPPSVNRVLASKACRTAIKFGDPLPLKACQELIQQLSATSFPFQCAHGRPSIVPLFSFAKSDS